MYKVQQGRFSRDSTFPEKEFFVVSVLYVCVLGGVDSNISVYEGFFSLLLLFDTIICLLNNNKNTNTPILSVCATHFV